MLGRASQGPIAKFSGDGPAQGPRKSLPAAMQRPARTTHTTAWDNRGKGDVMRKVSFYTIRLLATALLIGGTMALTPTPAPAQVAIGVSVAIAPPELPVYVQPVCPGDDYIWTPGYWAWDPDDGYYWVPGTWVLPPEPGLLWTPGYWAWGGNGFVFTAGY